MGESHVEDAKNHACDSLRMGSDYTGIDNSAPNWVEESNRKTQDIRSHAFTFKVSLKNPKNWSIRKKILELAGFKVLPKGGAVPVDMVLFNGFKIWLSRHKLTIYFPDWKQYWVDEARTGYNYAIADLLVLLNALEKVLSSDFRIKDGYHFKVSRQHHALVQNSLAKQYNREHKKLEVFDNRGELWLLIDNSDPHNIRMNDLEGVSRQKSPQDMDDVVKPFFNELRETQLMPKDIINTFDRIAKIQENQVNEASNVRSDVDKRLVWMDKNFQSHQRILEKMEKRLDSLMTTPKPKAHRLTKRDKAQKLLRKFGW